MLLCELQLTVIFELLALHTIKISVLNKINRHARPVSESILRHSNDFNSMLGETN